MFQYSHSAAPFLSALFLKHSALSALPAQLGRVLKICVGSEYPAVNFDFPVMSGTPSAVLLVPALCQLPRVRTEAVEIAIPPVLPSNRLARLASSYLRVSFCTRSPSRAREYNLADYCCGTLRALSLSFTASCCNLTSKEQHVPGAYRLSLCCVARRRTCRSFVNS